MYVESFAETVRLFVCAGRNVALESSGPSPVGVEIPREAVDPGALHIDTGMMPVQQQQQQQPAIHRERTWLHSCVACLCCFSCWRQILWALTDGDGHGRYERQGGRAVVATPTSAEGHRRHDERRRLLDRPPKFPGERPERNSQQDGPKQLMEAGVPPFPSLEKKERGLDPLEIQQQGSLTDFGDVCPTCLEPYTEEDPKIVTKCGHDFHLPCIYEWLERAKTCPVCFRPMSFEELQ